MHIFHDWDGCKCKICGRLRDEGHKWNGCRCAVCSKKRHTWTYPGEIHECKACYGNGMIHFEFNKPTNCLGCNGRGKVTLLTCRDCGDKDVRWWSGTVDNNLIRRIIFEENDSYKRFVFRLCREIGLRRDSIEFLQNMTWNDIRSSTDLVEYFDSKGIEEDIKRIWQIPGVLLKMERIFSINLTKGPWHTKVVLFKVLPAMIFDEIVAWANQFYVEVN